MVYKKEYMKQWRLKNKDKIKRNHKKEYLRKKTRYLERAKKYYEEHKEKMKPYMSEYNRKWHQKFRIMALDHYSKGKMECSCCGEKILDFLTIDHKKNNGTKHRKEIGAAHIFRWLVRNNYPEEYDVLCMNCNFAKGLKYNNGICPHKKVK